MGNHTENEENGRLDETGNLPPQGGDSPGNNPTPETEAPSDKPDGEPADSASKKLNLEYVELTYSEASAPEDVRKEPSEASQPQQNEQPVVQAPQPRDVPPMQPDGETTEAAVPVENGDQPADDGEEDEGENRRGCLRAVIYTAIVVAVAMLIAVATLLTVNDALGMYKPDTPVQVVIPKNTKNEGIAAILKDDKVINFKLAFEAYVKLNHVENMHYGTFTLNSNMGYGDIVKALQNPENDTARISVTIPEGYTVQKIAATLEEKNICSAASFLDAVDKTSLTFADASGITNTDKRYYRLEGYLFPDTYDFYKDEDPTVVAKAMLDNFSKKFTAQMKAKAQQDHMTVDQIVTLASVIQAEASEPAQMATVSSVFHNRLEKGTGSLQYLQSDATIFYIEKSTSSVLHQSDTLVDSPYNTYRNKGLPPGPICSPGLAALNAALSPASTNYYYFVTDSSNKYYYASTFAQHKKNVAAASSTARGTNVTAD